MGGVIDSRLLKGIVMSLWQIQPYCLSLAFVHPFLQSPALMTCSNHLFHNWSDSPGCRDISDAFCISRSPAVLTFLSISDPEMCLQPWVKIYLIYHLIYFFSFFLPVQHNHLNLLWQILLVETVYRVTSASTANTAEHTQWEVTLAERGLAQLNKQKPTKRKKLISGYFFRTLFFFFLNFSPLL